MGRGRDNHGSKNLGGKRAAKGRSSFPGREARTKDVCGRWRRDGKMTCIYFELMMRCLHMIN